MDTGKIIQRGPTGEIDGQSHHVPLRTTLNTDRPELIKVGDPSLLERLPTYGGIQRLARVDTAGRDLHSGVGVVDMIENQKLIITILSEHVHRDPESFGNPCRSVDVGHRGSLSGFL